MNIYLNTLICSSVVLIMTSCSSQPEVLKGSFGFDLNFLKKHQNVITLEDNNGKSQLILLPELQGRVATSTANGLAGNSYGWLNYDLIASGKFEEHFNPFGGEERFWMGPEGGQYAIFFKKGSEFTFDNWYTPKEIDTEAYEVISQSNREVLFQKKMSFLNYQDFKFDIQVNRKVSILDEGQIEEELGLAIPADINFVAYQSDNEIVNLGEQAWSKNSGLLSIWILGMYMPSENTKVILPYKGSLALNTSYFGTIPPDRLQITEKHVMFNGDGTARFKLGIPPQNLHPYAGSYDADKQTLTIVNYTFKGDTTYVNSVWREQDNPYEGDVINAYNDGPLDNGGQLGPFYELESSSSSKELKPGESIKHTHKTYHFEGNFDELNKISKKLLNKDLNELK